MPEDPEHGRSADVKSEADEAFDTANAPPHIDPPKTLSQKFAEAVTRMVGSPKFVIAQTLTLALWVGGNILAHSWNPSSQIILNLALSFQAAYTGPLVLITQNRQLEQDRKARENDYQVNLESKRRIEELHGKIDSLLAALAPVVREMTPGQRAALRIPETLLQQILEGRRDGDKPAVEDAAAELPERETLSERFADAVTGKIGSWKFIAAQTASLALWIAANATALVQHWDPYPFILLNLVLSFQAAYTGPFVMMSQNRQSALDRKAYELDYKVNREEECLIEELGRKIDVLVGLFGPVMAMLTPEQRAGLAHSAGTPPIPAANGDAPVIEALPPLIPPDRHPPGP